jgi:NDP-sugar pyrophosphorylase family protein
MLPVAILAGGLAKRVRPVTEKIPKSMIKFHGRPFIDYQLELLASSGVESVVLCLGFLGGIVRKYVGDSRHGLEVRYSFDGETPLGTGGAIKKALSFLGDEFFILYGDSYLPLDYRAVARAFELSKKKALMTVFRNDGRWDASNVTYADGIVTSYDKKSPSPDMSYIDYGLTCCLASEISKESAERFDIADVLTRFSIEGELAGFEVSERFYEIGSFDGIEDFGRYVKVMAALS